MIISLIHNTSICILSVSFFRAYGTHFFRIEKSFLCFGKHIQKNSKFLGGIID